MSVVDNRRIEDLERLARSLSGRVERLERDAAWNAPVSARRADARASDAPPPLPTVSLTPPPAEPGVQVADAHQRFEDLLGGRMLAWLGGLAVVVGIALFFAYAISRGWIGEAARVAGGGGASLGVLLLGIWLHEHRGRTDAARTLVAAAVAGLFITVFVASRVYAVIPVAVGFALALAVGATAGALAVRWEARVIAALGIIGGLLAPVLVGAPDDLATLAVLLAAAFSAIGLLLWRRWDWLGFGVVLVCAPQWLLWLTGSPSLAGALAVLVAFGALGHLAAIGFELRVPDSALRPSSSLLLTLNAAVLAIAGFASLTELGHPVGAGLWVASLAAAHLALALAPGGLARVSADIRLLVTTLGVVLGDVAFALLAHGPVLAVGFAATSMLFARLATRHVTRRNDRTLTELGLGAHTAGALLLAAAQAAPLGWGAGHQVGGTIALAAVAAATFTSARLTSSLSQAWRILLDTVALGVMAYLTAINLAGAELVLAWALEGVALAAIARRTSDQVAGVASLAFLAGATIHVLGAEAPPRALALGVSDLGAAAVALGALAAASLLIARTRLTISDRLSDRETTPSLIALGALALLYLASISIISAFQPSTIQAGAEILDLSVRQEGQMLLSCLWGLTGLAALIVGLRRDQRILRLGALAVLVITAAKVFLYDLSTLDSGYRIGSFIALGLLLLGGAYAYQRLRPPPAPDLRTVPPALR